MLDVCNEEDPPKGAPQPEVEGVRLGTKGCDAGVVDCLQKVTCRGRGTRYWETGRTLTLAPVSTRKRRPLWRSVTKNRRLGGRPGVLVAISTCLALVFPNQEQGEVQL